MQQTKLGKWGSPVAADRLCGRNHPRRRYNRELVGNELFGKIRLGNAFGCHVLGFEPRVLRIDDVTIEQVEIDELLSRSDIVTLHLPLTTETLGFIGRERLV